MSAPVAPATFTSNLEKGEEMAAASPTLKVVPQESDDSSKTLLHRLHEGFIMTVQKATSPSITVSTATIALLIVMIGQFGAGIWWGASISKDSTKNEKEIENLKSENATMKVYIDNLREKQIKMEAVQDNLVRDQQVLNLMIQQKGIK